MQPHFTPERGAAVFWGKVNRTGTIPPHRPELGPCWVWTASTKAATGYGQAVWDRRPRQAHRLAWTLTFGEIPSGLLVLHKCDNPPCVNPAHLFLGTHDDNSKDMIAKGRGAWQKNPAPISANRRVTVYTHKSHPHLVSSHGGRLGEAHQRAKLTEADVLAIRQGRKDGVSSGRLAQQFGVSLSTVKDIAQRRKWKHLT